MSCGQKNASERQDSEAINRKAKWIREALAAIASERYPRVKAISWWHENFDGSRLRIDSSPASLKAYQEGIRGFAFVTSVSVASGKLAVPSSGVYHSAYPDFGGTEDMVTAQRIKDFEVLAEKDTVWAYFSNNWYDSMRFPSVAVKIIHSEGKVPFIRMMPRSNFDVGGPDPVYTMQRIIDGDFDALLTTWAIEAKDTGIPLLVEFGTEVNGNWFPWNGQYNGGSESTIYGDPNQADGPERFRDAYRHIIDIFNKNSVDNITWFFHVDADGSPATSWNEISQYYPGDGYIDWIGLSVYGAQESDEEFQSFVDIMDDAYAVITTIADKPIAILEFAVTE
jgi:hypothetical protein